MTRLIFAALFGGLLLFGGTARAASSWGLPGEEIVRFDAKVVDLLCELTGDCPEQCGGGKRQLGLLTDEGTLIPAVKNKVAFAGAADELIDFCGKRVTADGLFTTNRGHKLFVLQFVREAPDGKWRGANRFSPKWAERNGLDAKDPKVKQWFRNDPRVKALIEKQGKLGLGPEADRKYMESQ
jgi:hypothetical protein